jgi:hypothetical protein
MNFLSSNIGGFRHPFLRVRKGAEGALINIHTNESAFIKYSVNEIVLIVMTIVLMVMTIILIVITIVLIVMTIVLIVMTIILIVMTI